MRKVEMAIVGAVLAVSVASCGNSVSKADFKAELDTRLGSAVDTQCIADTLEKSDFTFKKYEDLNADEQSKVSSATVTCTTSQVDKAVEQGQKQIEDSLKGVEEQLKNLPIPSMPAMPSN